MAVNWRSESGHRWAAAQGLWAGAAMALGPIFILEELAAISALVAIVGIGGSVVDLAFTRHRSHRAVAWVVLPASALALIYLAMPWSLPLPDMPGSHDAWDPAWPILGLALIAERLAARGWLTWRDRALGAAAGLVLTDAFTYGMPYVPLGCALLLAALAVRLPKPARVTLAVLSGLPVLLLGSLARDIWVGRALEWTAWISYGIASAWTNQRSRARPRAAMQPETA